MTSLETTIHIGLPAPISVLHLSDTHLTLADERDGERKVRLAHDRAPYFPESTHMIAEAVGAVRQTGCPLVHTGDLIDFVSEANLEAAKDFVQQTDCFMAAGNHEFSLYVGEAWEDADYRNQSLARVQAAFGNDIRFSVRAIGGVNFVAVDNSYYLLEEAQMAALKAVAQEGKPIVLLLHTPLYTPELFDAVGCYLMAVPEERMTAYSDYRFRQQKADETTRAAYEWILSCPLIRAVLTGHMHIDCEGSLPSGIPQILTGCTTLRTATFT